MKVFIAVLVLIFSFQSLTKADDIRDFQIEGMSIGDSLLDYYTREEIKNFIQDKQYPNSQRIKITNIKSDFFETYERVSADIIDDDTFVIVKLSGRLIYEDDIEECHKQMILIRCFDFGSH